MRDELPGDDLRGSGRIGELAEPLPFAAFADWVKGAMGLASLDAVPSDRPVRRVGVACGSAGEYLEDAAAAGCDAFLTGEARFHTALDARGRGVGLILLGHYASERFSLEELAEELAATFSGTPVRVSAVERDPLLRL